MFFHCGARNEKYGRFLSTQKSSIIIRIAREIFGEENFSGNSAKKGRNGRANTVNALNDNASRRLRCESACRARKVPHPGQ